jgi:tRNA(Ile)-lysidine synthase
MMEKVYKFIESNHMIEQGDTVILGLSGGADSVYLFHVLLELRNSGKIQLVCVHVNHGLRGESADRDESFVISLCEKFHVKYEIYHENVEFISQNRKQSLEEAGRYVRLEDFQKTMIAEHGTKLALAHHQNDSAETLLMNLARGTGLKGLCGIEPVRGNVIRPLLSLTRQEIESELAERGIAYCQDETNAGVDYTRNRIRHLVLPVLEEQVNAKAVVHMNETMRQMQRLWEYMQEQRIHAEKKCMKIDEMGRIVFLQEMFWLEPRLIQEMLVKHALEIISENRQNLLFTHVMAVLDLFQKQCGKTCDLPYGILATRIYEGVRLQKKSQETKKQEEGVHSMCISLQIPGETYLPSHKLTICSRILEIGRDFSVNQIPQKPYTKWFDYDIIKGGLIVRGRQQGDWIVIDRTGKRQKIKSYFINAKIAASERDQKLLIARENEVLWVVGHRMSSAYQVTDQTRRVLEIKIMEEESNVRED